MEADAYAEMRSLEDHHWWFAGRWRVVQDLLRSALATARTDARRRGSVTRVVEIGCGTGGNLAGLQRSAELAGDADRRLGIDRDPGAVAFCAGRSLAADLVRADGLALPLADGSVEFVLALDVIEHFEDDELLLAEIFRVLRPGGQLVASVPLFPGLWSPHDEFLHHARRYRPGDLERKLAAAGLAVERRHGFNFLLLPPIALVRWVKARLRRAGRPTASDLFALPAPLNTLLGVLFRLEAVIVRFVPVPLGLSLMVRARKA